MKYYRCKCGKLEAWSSLSVHDCDGCEKCGTTLAQDADGHRPIGPHEWVEEWDINRQTGDRFRVRECKACGRRERVPATEEGR